LSTEQQQERYSIKYLEPLYMSSRTTMVKNAGSSLVAYEEWLERSDQSLLDSIEAYNRDDCISTQKLRGWLEKRRAESRRQAKAALITTPVVVPATP
jgi:predicted RecB family nuclease